jgi:hypothetical protein
MGRINASVVVENVLDPSRSFRCDALVDTGASRLVLPRAWKERPGDLPVTRTVEVHTAAQATVDGEVCGPVRIRIEGFPPVSSEVLFLDLAPTDRGHEPLPG